MSTSYVNPVFTPKVRQEQLLYNHNFMCDCVRCGNQQRLDRSSGLWVGCGTSAESSAARSQRLRSEGSASFTMGGAGGGGSSSAQKTAFRTARLSAEADAHADAAAEAMAKRSSSLSSATASSSSSSASSGDSDMADFVDAFAAGNTDDY